MAGRQTGGEQTLTLLGRLLPSNEQFYIWGFTRDKTCLGTTCPEEDRETLEQALLLFGGSRLEECLQSGEFRVPQLLGSPVGMQWAAVPTPNRSGDLVLVIGPVFYMAPDTTAIRNELHADRHEPQSHSFSRRLLDRIGHLPVISYAIFIRYVIMVHNTINGQQLGLEDLEKSLLSDSGIHAGPVDKRDRNRIYLSEKAMLQMVREGNINYGDILQTAIRQSPGVPVHGRDPLRQAKTSIIVFTSLVCRAAMEGGLSPDTAYSLGDAYIQAVEDCRDSAELSALAYTMYNDFITRVHSLKIDPNYSHAIQKCCDYIELSLDKRITAADLASLAGYTEYYLTVKFKKETGMSVSSYVRQAKVKRAQLLLETTDLSVGQIAERLAFNTPNYFIKSFRETTGCTPAEYRKRIQTEG